MTTEQNKGARYIFRDGVLNSPFIINQCPALSPTAAVLLYAYFGSLFDVVGLQRLVPNRSEICDENFIGVVGKYALYRVRFVRGDSEPLPRFRLQRRLPTSSPIHFGHFFPSSMKPSRIIFIRIINSS